MNIVEKLREVDSFMVRYIILPALTILLFGVAIYWFVFWSKPLFEYSLKEYSDPGRWYDIIAFISVSTASFFVALVVVKKFILILLNNEKQIKVNKFVSVLIKIFAVPFGISMIYLLHGVYVVVKEMF